MPSDKKLQQISVKNIGEFGALMIQKGSEVYGKRFDISGDELSSRDLVESLSVLLEKNVLYNESDINEMLNSQKDMGLMYKWFIEVGYSSDIDKLNEQFPEVEWETFEDYLRRVGKEAFIN